MFCEESLGKIKFRTFPKRVGPRILSLESVDYFGTNEHYWVVKKYIYIRILIPERRESFICRSAQVIDCVQDRKRWEKGKNTVAHKSTPNSKWHFLSLKAHSEFRNFTPISKTSLRIRKLHSEFEDITPNSKTLLRLRKDQNPLLSAAAAMGYHLAYYLEFL